MEKGRKLFDKVKPYAKKMAAVGHESRLAILYLLAYGPMDAGTIALTLGLQDSLISHHLHTLHVNAWILRTRQGRQIIYTLNDKAFDKFRELFRETPAASFFPHSKR